MAGNITPKDFFKAIRGEYGNAPNKVELKKDIKTNTMYSDRTFSEDGISLNVREYSSVVLFVERCFSSHLKPQTRLGTGQWISVKAKNFDTGREQYIVSTPGVYIVNVEGFTEFRVPVHIAHPTGMVTAHAVTSNESFKTNEISYKENTSLPVKLLYDYEITDSSIVPSEIDKKTDAVYGRTGNRVRKSIDFGVSWDEELLNVVEASAKNILKLENGALLVSDSLGNLWLSDENESNFSVVHTMETPGTYVHDLFGMKAYDNIVVCAEYGSKTIPDNARKAYLSTDYGKTWKMIFEAPQRENLHLHDVAFDPYDDIIWICNGDSRENANIHWSKDWGETWHQAFEYGFAGSQYTQIIPLPNCVLFTSDSDYNHVARWNRPKEGINSIDKFVLEPAFTLYRQTDFEFLGTTAAITYGADAIAYFGFLQYYNAIVTHSTIYATKDGINFYPVWRDSRKPQSEQGFVGIYRVSGPSESGAIIAGNTGSSGNSFVKLQEPEWK